MSIIMRTANYFRKGGNTHCNYGAAAGPILRLESRQLEAGEPHKASHSQAGRQGVRDLVRTPEHLCQAVPRLCSTPALGSVTVLTHQDDASLSEG